MKRTHWALVLTESYRASFERLSSKFRGQISRKAMDLIRNPKPGGSKTQLVGYDGLYRLRAGDFRIIYAYDDSQVQLLTLSRRTEHTYDDLDTLEIQELKGWQEAHGPTSRRHDLAKWDELARERSAPKRKADALLAKMIDQKTLKSLEIPDEYHATLLAISTDDELSECTGVPPEYVERLLEWIYPKQEMALVEEAHPVVLLEDLVDARAAITTGPVEASMDSRSADGGADADSHPAASSPESGGTLQPPVFASTRRADPMGPYRGNTSKGIGKDARYTVKLNNTIELILSGGDGTDNLLTTDVHPELIELVNEAKRVGGSQQGGGGFIINEYRHVLVPTMDGRVLHAGLYTRDLEFRFEEGIVSPVAPPGIRPGNIWPGPHPGSKYTLAASATDVYYDEESTPGTRLRVRLSDHHPAEALSGLLSMCRAVKPNGGAIYLNEAREIFAPVEDGEGFRYRYIGHLGEHPWFPEPV